MPRWNVLMHKDGDYEDVGADYARIIDGALVFTNSDGQMTVAYSEWRYVERAEED
jgi:hypothetical protein